MAYIYNMADTWADAGTTFTAIKMNVTDTASNAASLLMDLQVGGSSRFNVTKAGHLRLTTVVNSTNATISTTTSSNSGFYTADGTDWGYTRAGSAMWQSGFEYFRFTSNSSVGWSTSVGSAADLTLFRDAANILAQRNGTNAQAFRVYNTFTDASNYERVSIGWSANTLTLAAENAGTGSNRGITLQGKAETIVESTLSQVTLKTGGSSRWFVSAAGLLGAVVDNTLDIGASGANRPRNLYMGSWIRMATTTVASLPAAATAGAGARMFVTDASAPVFGSAVAGGGAVTVPVYSTGSAWNVG